MLITFVLSSMLADASAVAQSVTISAQLDAEELHVGEEYQIAFRLTIPENLEVPAGDRMKHLPILQLDVPPSVELVGKTLSTHRELARNEFLMEPYERVIRDENTRIRFRLVKKPNEDESIGLIVTAFLTSTEEGRSFFLRRRLALPMKPNAKAEPASSQNSRWGVDDKLLQIGDKAPEFDLPKVDGSGNVSLGTLLGKKNIVVTTYRASW